MSEEDQIQPYQLTGREALIYWRGVKDGVRRFAWWRNGEQWVGSVGKTLKTSEAEISKEAAGERPAFYP